MWENLWEGLWTQVKKNQFLLLLLLTGAVYFFLKYISPLVGPILLAMLFVTIFGPLLKKMQKTFHIHRQLGAIILLLLGGGFLVGLLWVLYSWIFGNLPVWSLRLAELKDEMMCFLQKGFAIVGNLVGVDGAYLENVFYQGIAEHMEGLEGFGVPRMLSQSLTYMKILGRTGIFSLTFLIATILLAKDYDQIMNRLLERESCHVLLEVICGVIRYLATYVKAQLIILLTNSVMLAGILWVAGIQNGVLWGILAGILDAFPFVGTGMVLVPLAVFQLLDGYYVRALMCICVYGISIFLRQMLEPRLIGRRMGVPPIAVLLSLYAGIRMFGIIGILKGPLGFVLILETYKSLKREDSSIWGK